MNRYRGVKLTDMAGRQFGSNGSLPTRWQMAGLTEAQRSFFNILLMYVDVRSAEGVNVVYIVDY